MDFIYKHYFINNFYPSLILKLESGKYKIRDANNAFLDLMQVQKGSVMDKDFFEAFLSYEENITSVTTTIIRTSLAYVEAYKVPKKVAKVGIIHSIDDKGEKIRYWEIYIYPVMDEKDNIDYLLYITKDIADEEGY